MQESESLSKPWTFIFLIRTPTKENEFYTCHCYEEQKETTQRKILQSFRFWIHIRQSTAVTLMKINGFFKIRQLSFEIPSYEKLKIWDTAEEEESEDASDWKYKKQI